MVPTRVVTTQLHKPTVNLRFYQRPTSSFSSNHKDKVEFKLFTATSPTVSTEFTDPPEQEVEIQSQEEKFDWYAQWYPVMPVCDLDKRAPHAKKVMGLDIVVWWDRNESSWKVFDDSCPHRLAPLSEGRIDQWGRLQCVYHGWCFSGSGDCKLIPQLPPDGPPVISQICKETLLFPQFGHFLVFSFNFIDWFLIPYALNFCYACVEILRVLTFLFIVVQSLTTEVPMHNKKKVSWTADEIDHMIWSL